MTSDFATRNNPSDFSARDAGVNKALLLTVRKKPSITHEQFIDYWACVHGLVVASMPGILQYRQIPVAPVDSEIWPKVGNGIGPAIDDTYDGFAELSFRSTEDLGRFGTAVSPFA